MENFVRDYGTGNQIPDPPAFVNYQIADAIPSSSARPTSRPAQFVRSSARELPPRQMSMPPEEEPIVNTAGIGAGGGAGAGAGRRIDPYGPGEGSDLSRQNTRSVTSTPYTNGYHSGTSTSPSGAPPPQSVHRNSTMSTQSHPSHQSQQLQRMLQDPYADPIDPTADTYIKVGSSVYKVDPSKDPQQQPVSSFRGSPASPTKQAVGSDTDPLMKQLEELKNAVSTTGSVRRNTLVKPKPGGTTPDPKPEHRSTLSTSSRNGTGPTSLSPPVTGGTSVNRSPSPVRDYRNSAEVVVGAHPSASRPSSPNPPTAAFMVPKTAQSGAESVKDVLADYQQSLPGERKSISRSNSRGHAPSISQGSIQIPQGQNLARPSSQLGHAGVGAHGSRSNSPQPISRGPSPQPGQVSRNFIQPPAQVGAGVARAPSPNTVGIALDPSGRVLHDEMAQRYQQQGPPPPQPSPLQRPPQTQQPSYNPPPPPQQSLVQHHPQQQRRSSYTPSMAPPVAQQTYAVTPPPPGAYPAPSPQPNYVQQQQQQQQQPPPHQPAYNAPPPQAQPLQYQPPQQQQQPRYNQPQQQQPPPGQYGSVNSINGVQRGGPMAYYGNQTPPQQQQVQPLQIQPLQTQQPPPQMLAVQPPQQQQQQQQRGVQPQQQQRGYQQPQQQYRDPSPAAGRSPSPQPPPQTTEDGSSILFYGELSCRRRSRPRYSVHP